MSFRTVKDQRIVGVASRLRSVQNAEEAKASLEMKQESWTLGVYEFMDNEHFNTLDTVLNQLSPSQCYVKAAKGRDGEAALQGDAKRVSYEHGIFLPSLNKTSPC